MCHRLLTVRGYFLGLWMANAVAAFFRLSFLPHRSPSLLWRVSCFNALSVIYYRFWKVVICVNIMGDLFLETHRASGLGFERWRYCLQKLPTNLPSWEWTGLRYEMKLLDFKPLQGEDHFLFGGEVLYSTLTLWWHHSGGAEWMSWFLPPAFLFTVFSLNVGH